MLTQHQRAIAFFPPQKPGFFMHTGFLNSGSCSLGSDRFSPPYHCCWVAFHSTQPTRDYYHIKRKMSRDGLFSLHPHPLVGPRSYKGPIAKKKYSLRSFFQRAVRSRIIVLADKPRNLKSYSPGRGKRAFRCRKYRNRQDNGESFPAESLASPIFQRHSSPVKILSPKNAYCPSLRWGQEQYALKMGKWEA